ncbi:hypothetical protein WJ88_28525 [Burkholderia ubonensis]|nr:hypothetical protein WJ88_28525 [Burkholderia ubonensis]
MEKYQTKSENSEYAWHVDAGDALVRGSVRIERRPIDRSRSEDATRVPMTSRNAAKTRDADPPQHAKSR